MRLALKLATGAGKTTFMAMLIAWHTIKAVLQANDPDSYYASRELIPSDMLGDLERAKIVITNYHAFKLREWLELSSGGRACSRGGVRHCTRSKPRGRCCSASCLNSWA